MKKVMSKEAQMEQAWAQRESDLQRRKENDWKQAEREMKRKK